MDVEQNTSQNPNVHSHCTGRLTSLLHPALLGLKVFSIEPRSLHLHQWSVTVRVVPRTAYDRCVYHRKDTESIPNQIRIRDGTSAYRMFALSRFMYFKNLTRKQVALLKYRFKADVVTPRPLRVSARLRSLGHCEGQSGI